jgi:glutamate racemase
MLDSGLGGLTVLGELRRLRPDLDVVYFADTARAPYGDRSLAQVAAYGQCIIDELAEYDPKMIVVASGTTCAAFEAFAPHDHGIPLVGVVETGAAAAVASSASGRIGVIATVATIASTIFERALARVQPAVCVTSVGAPRLVPLVEAGAWASDDARVAVEEYCRAFVAARCDAVILGCTHFPHLRSWFARALGPDVALVDPAVSCAQATAAMCASAPSTAGSLTFLVSGDPAAFARLAGELTPLAGAATHAAKFSGEMEKVEDHHR